MMINLAQVNAPSVYVFESSDQGFNTKTLFYDDGAEVAAFDTQFTQELAKQAIAFLRTKTQHPLAYAVVTHPNPDKFNGIPAFQAAGAKVIMAASTAAAMPEVDAYKRAYFVGAGMFTNETYPKLGRADVTFTGAYELTLKGGGRVLLQELAKPGVSSGQTVAFLPDANALIVGDLVHEQAHAWLEGGLVGGKPSPTLGGWADDLRELAARYGETNPVVYGGRGDAVELARAVADQLAYLDAVKAIVVAYIAEATQAQRAELATGSAAGQYAVIQRQFEARFPSYKLGYMIGYGVYGLVGQELAAYNLK